MASADTTTPAGHVRGSLVEQREGTIVLGIPGTDYKLHLTTAGPVQADAHSQVVGRIIARARRVDRPKAGGRYFEPLMGRPRTLQGTVLATDPSGNTITVQCPVPFVCTLTHPGQNARDFAPGDLVFFNIERGAAFEQA